MSKYIVIWEFEVKPEKLPEFEAIYNPEGEWAQLLGQGEGFTHTELIKNIETSNRYIVLDYWQSRMHYLAFRERFNQAYDALDAKSRLVINGEKLLGSFELVGNEKTSLGYRAMVSAG